VSIYPTHWRVWEWTNTCFSPVALEPAGEARMTNTNCGVRVASSAIPRTGGCAAGVPPANLGFRMVVEDEKWPTRAAHGKRTIRTKLSPACP
jgi:formylglycine-generating enzyme required for sulfatase activity